LLAQIWHKPFPSLCTHSCDSPGLESFSIIEPFATLVRTDRPRFRWTPLPQADSYVVSIYDEALHVVTTSEPLTDTQWIVSRPLKAGIIYTWIVTASKVGKDVIAPVAPGRAEFRVLEKADVNKLDHRIGGISLKAARAILFAEAGLLSDAEAGFKDYLAKRPNDQRVRELLKTIRSWRGIDD
jgi:hypothetical protein